MTNHPNRSRAKSPASNPKPEQIKSARTEAGLTQTQAANLVHTSLRGWQQWESEPGSISHRRMHAAIWELFLIKTHKITHETSDIQELE